MFLLSGVPISEVPERLINLPVTGSVQGLSSSSCSDKKFNPEVFSRIPKVFQEDVSLSGVLPVFSNSVGWEADVNT